MDKGVRNNSGCEIRDKSDGPYADRQHQERYMGIRHTCSRYKWNATNPGRTAFRNLTSLYEGSAVEARSLIG
jgi:hypothetical protein